MTKRISAAHAKAHLSELVSGVAHGGERYVIERHGKPVAALVSMDDFARLPVVEEKRGALALLGVFDGVLSDDEIEEFVETVNSARKGRFGRPVNCDD
jgi:prevent-host-death family protein